MLRIKGIDETPTSLKDDVLAEYEMLMFGEGKNCTMMIRLCETPSLRTPSDDFIKNADYELIEWCRDFIYP